MQAEIERGAGALRKSREAVREDFARLSTRWEWEWWATLTFPDPAPGVEGAARKWKRWEKWLTSWHRPKLRPQYIRATELQKRGAVHYHALMIVGGIRRLTAMDEWEKIAGGFARIWPYNPRLGAAFYTGKYLGKGPFDLDFFTLEREPLFEDWNHAGPVERGTQGEGSQEPKPDPIPCG
jgi:hypothetical protein